MKLHRCLSRKFGFASISALCAPMASIIYVSRLERFSHRRSGHGVARRQGGDVDVLGSPKELARISSATGGRSVRTANDHSRSTKGLGWW
jgi:hypothetical protein